MKKKLLMLGAVLMAMVMLGACGDTDTDSDDRDRDSRKTQDSDSSDRDSRKEQDSKKRQDLDEVDYNGDLEGLKVSGTIYYIYDWYCETTSDNDRQVSREYIIDAGDEYYMGMLVEAADMDDPEALMEACLAYENNQDAGIEDDGAGVFQAQYRVSGTIRKMPEDSQEYYYEYLTECGLSKEEQEIFLPYYLVVE